MKWGTPSDGAEARAFGLEAILLAGLLLAGCAGRPAPGTVYRSPDGYRVLLPGPDWRLASESRADLELRHRDGPAAMLVNATCDSRQASRPVEALRRELLAGLSARDVQLDETVSVSGREAAHMVVDGAASRPGERVRVELLVLKVDRCVYDLLYAAPPGDFARWHPDFQRLVGSFALE